MVSDSAAERPVADTGSFRDPTGRVYHLGSRILRGLDEDSAANMGELIAEPFFKKLLADRAVVGTKIIGEKAEKAVRPADGHRWPRYLEHEPVAFVSYPYEWTFSMLRDAALLQLRIIETSLENGWTLKDASAYNIQWIGSRPIFIDVGSFEPWPKGEPWRGYQQFCAMFLTPLMLKAYLGLDHTNILRSRLDGVSAGEASKMLRGVSRYKKGVMSHIVFPAMVDRSIAKRERDAAPAKARSGKKHSKAMVIGLVQSMTRLVSGFKPNIAHTAWSHYDQTHTYQEADFDHKQAFVERHVGATRRPLIWDIGCNTGVFSKIAAAHADNVIAFDADHDAAEQPLSIPKPNATLQHFAVSARFGKSLTGPGLARWRTQDRAAKRHPRPGVVLSADPSHAYISQHSPRHVFGLAALAWVGNNHRICRPSRRNGRQIIGEQERELSRLFPCRI